MPLFISSDSPKSTVTQGHALARGFLGLFKVLWLQRSFRRSLAANVILQLQSRPVHSSSHPSSRPWQGLLAHLCRPLLCHPTTLPGTLPSLLCQSCQNSAVIGQVQTSHFLAP